MHWFKLYDDCHVSEAGYIDTSNIHPTRVILEWVLVFIISGERTFRIYNEDFTVRANEFFILPPHIPHYGLFKDNHKALFIHFKMNGYETTSPDHIDSSMIVIPLYGKIPNETNCIEMMDYVVRHRAPPFYSQKFTSIQMLALLYQLSISAQKNALWNNRESTLAIKILRYIDDNKSVNLKCEDYERTFGKCYRQLNDIFKHVYKVSIKQMFITIRINHAKLLLNSGYTITQVCSECGFDDYLYFLKTFKSRTGMTPTEYKNQQ